MAIGAVQSGLLISALPSALQEFVAEDRAQFSEGQLDKIDTENELRALMKKMLGLQTGPEADAGLQGPEALNKDQLIALLVDWLKSNGGMPNGQHRGTMPKQNFSSMRPSSFNGPGSARTSSPVSSGTASVSKTEAGALQGNSNAQKAFNYFVNKGLTPQQAAGIVGNLQAESGVDPGKHQVGGPAFGIAQWEGSRQTALKNFAAQRGQPADALETQLDFMWHELQTSERGALSKLKGTTNARDAAIQFELAYERAGIKVHGKRAAYANEAERLFAVA